MKSQSGETARALVLEEFGRPFILREFPLPEPGPGEVLARITAAGVCGSDLHMHAGHDPRTPLPIILGHEGVGEIVSTGSDASAHDGGELRPGMPVVWERSLTCGTCFFCNRGQRHLCVERRVYGINMSCVEPPHLSGNYSTHILLRRGTSIFPLEESTDPATVVAATCSGATAAHGHELAGIEDGDTVVIYGCGPVGLFQIAFARVAGANGVIVITRAPGVKADLARAFGAEHVFYREKMTAESVARPLNDRTHGIGVDVVIDTTPDPTVFRDALLFLRRGGTYINSGLAAPAESVPLDLYADVVCKNLTIRGVWAGDASHLQSALDLIVAGKHPFDRLVTHRFPLEKHEEAWRVLKNKEGVKVVFEPQAKP